MSYIFEEAHAACLAETYVEAARELLEPFPSTEIADFPQFSKLIGGLRPREYSILCGGTGVGKTTLMANMSKSLILQQVPHFVASVETGRTDFTKRMMSALAKEDWNGGDPIPVERLKSLHSKYAQQLQSQSMWLSRYENRFALKKLINDIAWMVERKGCKIAIIDNLNFFMEVTRASDQVIEMDRVTHELVIFCKNVDVHVIMIMHPKKTEDGRVVSEFDIKGSSTAVQEAHNVFLFNRPSKDLLESEQATKHDREIKIAKMRRRGKAVNARLILKSSDGVSYEEGGIFC
jgi:replicative DNA helicase